MKNMASCSDCRDEDWDAFVAGHAQAHFLQTSGWAALKSQFGWQSRRVALLQDGRIIAGASLLLRRVAGLTLAYIPKGPLTDWQDRVLTDALFSEIEGECRRIGVAVLKIEPELADSPEHQALLGRYGFRASPQTIQPHSTIVLNIAAGDDAILQDMKSKWRYNIRLAKRKNVTVRELSAVDLPEFDVLMQVTGERDGFAVHNFRYYAAAHQLLVPKHAVFLLAEYAGDPLASIVVATTGQTAWYLWGASNNHERNRMPNYALQWTAMQWAKQRGATR